MGALNVLASMLHKFGRIPENMYDQFAGQVQTNWIRTRFSMEGALTAPWFGWDERKDQHAGYVFMMERTRAAVADAKLHFVFIHLPVPHPLGIYNRRTGALGPDSASNYIDNLALSDRMLLKCETRRTKAPRPAAPPIACDRLDLPHDAMDVGSFRKYSTCRLKIEDSSVRIVARVVGREL